MRKRENEEGEKGEGGGSSVIFLPFIPPGLTSLYNKALFGVYQSEGGRAELLIGGTSRLLFFSCRKEGNQCYQCGLQPGPTPPVFQL